MANEATRFSDIIDALWGKDVPTAKKLEGANNIVAGIMGRNYTPEALAAMSNDQKADAILTAVRASLLRQVEVGGQLIEQRDLEGQVVNAGSAAKNAFDPDQE